MMSDRFLTQMLLDCWRENGVIYRAGCRDEEVRRWEQEQGVTLPDDLRDYFRAADSFEVGQGIHLVHFWSLAQLRPLPQEFGQIPTSLPEPEAWFAFADVLIDSYFYAIRLTTTPDDPTPVICFLEDEWWEVAPSFTDLLRYYIERPELISEPLEFIPKPQQPAKGGRWATT
jgi:hypothetical protein